MKRFLVFCLGLILISGVSYAQEPAMQNPDMPDSVEEGPGITASEDQDDSGITVQIVDSDAPYEVFILGTDCTLNSDKIRKDADYEVFAGCMMNLTATIEADNVEWYRNDESDPFAEGNAATIPFFDASAGLETITVAATDNAGPSKRTELGEVSFTVSIIPSVAPKFEGDGNPLADNIMMYVNNPNRWAEGFTILTITALAAERLLCALFGVCVIA